MVKVILLLLVVGCQAPVGSTVPIARDSASSCAAMCGSIGLPLESVVIMANNVGCVCRAASPSAPGQVNQGATSSGGMAAVLMQQQEEESRRRSQQSYGKK